MNPPAPMLDKSPARVNLSVAAPILFLSILGWGFAALLGLGAAWIARFSGLSNMAAAQITIGVVGLAAGWSHSLLISKEGGQASWKQHILISAIWALTCICGVTPLFFVMGAAWKMGMMTFYNFAAAGALGGMATAIVMRPCFPNAWSRDGLTYSLITSLSLGCAAAGGDLFGDRLQGILPAVLAWPLAAVIPVLIMGFGSGLSLIRFLRPGKSDRKRGLITRRADTGQPAAEKADRLHIGVLFLLLTPFYLNDFSNIYVSDWRLWIFIDYTSVKLLPVSAALWLICTGRMRLAEFGWTRHTITGFIAAFFIGTLTVTFILQNGDLILNRFPDYALLGEMPKINNAVWRWIDLTIGLLMVGICEEFVFRGYLYSLISRYTRRSWVAIASSAVAFGFIHWSGGFHMVMLAAAAGAVLMLIYLQTRSLPGIILAHFAVDLIDAANILPKPIPIP